MDASKTLSDKVAQLKRQVEQAREQAELAQAEYAGLKAYLEAVEAFFKPSQQDAKTVSHPTGLTVLSTNDSGRESPLRDAILKVLLETRAPMQMTVIEKRLKERNFNFGKSSIWTVLQKLKTKGWVKKISRGAYQISKDSL